jgi:hypothetical protein
VPDHKHLTGAYEGSDNNGWGRATAAYGFSYQSSGTSLPTNFTAPSGGHSHNFEGGTETRPVNVSVNYIVKY